MERSENSIAKGSDRQTHRGKKVLYFLARMSEEDHRDFGHWLASPLHGSSPQLAQMLEAILSTLYAAADEVPEGIDPEIFRPIFAYEGELDKKKLAYIWIRLAKLRNELYNFLAWRRFKEDDARAHIYLLDEMRSRGWEKHLFQVYKNGHKALPQPTQARRFRTELDLETLLNGYLASQATAADKHLDEVFEALDQHYILQTLKYACAGTLGNAPQADPEAAPLLATTLELLREKPASFPLVTRAYYHALEMLRHHHLHHVPGEIDHFTEFNKAFHDPAAFARDEAMDLFIHGQNYCILRIRQGQDAFLDHFQALYDRVLESGVAFREGLLSLQFYKNAVELMCRLKRFGWSERFVERYRAQIAHDPNQLAYAYNLAVVRFHQQDFRAVVELLYNRIGELDRMDFAIGARVYLCQALWETGEIEWLLTVLHAFNEFLRRKKDLATTRR
ncbi:MAG: hypothetical protein AAF570_15410, partial [Bacteroidota bacterium]